MLFEYVGEVIFVLVVAVGGDIFVFFFVGFLSLLLCKTVSVLFFDFEFFLVCVFCVKLVD